jgi:hypothetical protein
MTHHPTILTLRRSVSYFPDDGCRFVKIPEDVPLEGVRFPYCHAQYDRLHSLMSEVMLAYAERAPPCGGNVALLELIG